jgi:hypothetical protein
VAGQAVCCIYVVATALAINESQEEPRSQRAANDSAVTEKEREVTSNVRKRKKDKKLFSASCWKNGKNLG